MGGASILSFLYLMGDCRSLAKVRIPSGYNIASVLKDHKYGAKQVYPRARAEQQKLWQLAKNLPRQCE